MKGFVFLCSDETEPECLTRLLFGTDRGDYFEKYFRSITPGDYIFLYNYSRGSLRGPFRALTECGPKIEPDAWKDYKKGGFPYQVRVDDSQEFAHPLGADDLGGLLAFTHTSLGLIPHATLQADQLSRLLARFQGRNDDLTPMEMRGRDVLGWSYIFRCNRETGAKCFDENIMGAPATAFRNVVSKVQPGDTIYLWVLDERRLYGVWKAKSRGQYWPDAFAAHGRSYPAVVICERTLNLPQPIDGNIVRSVVPYDGAVPPYRVTLEQSPQLTEALLSANATEEIKGEPIDGEPQYCTDDGHRVRSRGEALIDNWLFHHGFVHAYEYLVVVDGKRLRSDFFLPDKRIHIEFWGVVDDPDYDRRRKEKVGLYRKAGLELLEVFPRDLAILNEHLLQRL